MKRVRKKGDRRTRIVLNNRIVAAFAVVILCLSCVLAAVVIRRPIRVLVTVQEGSGSVTYRGAMVSDSWCNPPAGLSPDGSWIFDSKTSTYTAASYLPLEIELPAGEECALVFNYGPDEGVAVVEARGERFEFNLYNNTVVEYGKSFQIPGVEPMDRSYYALPLVILAVLIALMGYVYAGNDMQRKTRSRGIEIYRFLFSLVIMLHHIGWQFSFNLFSAGYLAVDMFFIVSGYFLAAHYERKTVEGRGVLGPEESALQYAAGRWKRMFFHHSWAFLVAAFSSVVLLKNAGWKQILFDNWLEFLMLEETGLGNEAVINGVGWYCSALFLASFLVYYSLCRNKKAHVCVIMPITAVLAFSYFYRYGDLNRYLQNPLMICDGAIRGFVELSMGCACYYAVVRIKGGQYRFVQQRLEPWMYGLTETLCFGALMYIMWKPGGYKPGWFVSQDFMAIPIMVLLVIVVLSEKSILHKLWDNSLSAFLGKLSFSIFLNHTVILGLLTKFMIGRPVPMILSIYLGTTIGYSVLTMLVIDALENVVFRKRI